MRDFNEIAAQYHLKKFLDSASGTLYFIPYEQGAPALVVRRFDGELPPTLTVPYADLTRAAKQWIDSHVDLARLVRVEQPLEVGRDFIARKHHRHYVPTTAYANWDEPLEPPPELDELRAAFQAAQNLSCKPRDRLISNVLAQRSRAES